MAVVAFLWAMALDISKHPDLFLALAYVSCFSIIILFILTFIKP
jgi:hypothetical protein